MAAESRDWPGDRWRGDSEGVVVGGGASPAGKRVRADLVLVEQGLAPSRETGAGAHPGRRGPGRRSAGRQGGRAGGAGCGLAAAHGADALRVAGGAEAGACARHLHGRARRGGWRWTWGPRRGGSPTVCCRRARRGSTASTWGTASWTPRWPEIRGWWCSTAPTSGMPPPDLLPERADLGGHRRLVHLPGAGAAGVAASAAAGGVADRAGQAAVRGGAGAHRQGGHRARRDGAGGCGGGDGAAARALGYRGPRANHLADHGREG